MGIYKWFLNGVEQTTREALSMQVSKSVKGYTGSFSFTIANPQGVNEGVVEQNDTIKIQIYDFTTSTYDTVLEGYVNSIDEKDEKLNISGVNWSGRLYERDVTETFRHREVSWMANYIFEHYFPEFTRTNIDNTGTETLMNEQATNDGTLTLNSSNQKWAQKFTPTVENVIKVGLYIQSSSSGIADIEIRSDNSGTPSVTDILSQETNVTLSNGWNYAYATRKSLTVGGSYWIVVTWKGGSFQLSKTGTTNTGRVARSTAATESWSTQAYNDLEYRTYSTDGKIIEQVKFSAKKAADALKELSDVIGDDNWVYYVDDDMDGHFEPEVNNPSGYSYNAANTFERSTKTDGRQIYNHIIIYGGEQLTENYTNSYVGTGQQKVFLISPGHPDKIKQVTLGTTPTTAYTASLEQNIIVMTSAVPNGTTLNILQDYRTPIVADSRNNESITQYGERVMSKSDANIVSKQRAKEIADAYKKLYSDPRAVINLNVFLNPNLLAGYLLGVLLADLGIDTETQYLISKVTHTCAFGKPITSLELISNDIATVPEVLKQLKAEVEAIRMQQVNTDAPLLKTFALPNNMGMTTTITKKSRYPCDSFIIGHDENSLIGNADAVISDFEDYTQWSSSEFTLSNNTNSAYFWVGSKSMKCVWASSGLGYLLSTVSVGDISGATGAASGVPAKGTIGLWLYRESGATMGTIKLRIGSSSSNYLECTAANYSSTTQANGMNYYVFDLNTGAATGTPDWTAVDYVRLEINRTSASGTVYLDYMTASESNKIGRNGIGNRYIEVTL